MKSNNRLLIDMQYIRGRKKEKVPDYLYVIWRDMDTGKKHVDTIPEPMMDIYFEKPEYRNHDYLKTYEKLEHLNKYTCKYSDIKFEVAKEWGQKGRDIIDHVVSTKDYKSFSLLDLCPYAYGHDFDVITYYRNAWYNKFEAPAHKEFKISFADIEVDSLDVAGFPNAKECPIDLVTIVDSYNMKSYTFALVEREYKKRDVSHLREGSKERLELEEHERIREEMQKKRTEQEIALQNDIEGLKEELHSMFDESYGDIDYNFYFYKDERKMLVHLFQLIHMISPDFVLFWNISFDIPFILERMEVLGLNPMEIIPDPEFISKKCVFQKDKNNFDIKNKSDYFHVTSKTIYYDQMILYAAKRKGQAELRSNKLTYIAKKEIGDEKLDYSEDGDIKRIGYTNYRKYFIYNIKDVLLQVGIEKKTGDLNTLYVTSYENLTQYKDVWKQTVVLRNVQYKYHLSHGYVPGANENGILARLHPSDDDSSFDGALVGNSKLISNFGRPMFGKPTNYLFDNSIDMDMSAFYPNTNALLNIDPNNLLWKVICDPSQFSCRGGKIPFRGITDVQLVKENDPSWTNDIAKEIFDNFQSRNYLSLGYKFMNLPSIEEVEQILEEDFDE